MTQTWWTLKDRDEIYKRTDDLYEHVRAIADVLDEMRHELEQRMARLEERHPHPVEAVRADDV